MSQDGTVQHNLESVEARRHRPLLLSSQSTSWSDCGTHRSYPRISITESDEQRDGKLPVPRRLRVACGSWLRIGRATQNCQLWRCWRSGTGVAERGDCRKQ